MGPATPPPTRLAYVLTDGSNQEVAPTDILWPMRYVLRRVTMLDELLIDDDENPYPVINVIHATAIPQEDLPFGIGLPWKMRFSAKADSEMAFAIADSCKYFGNPATWMDNAIKSRMQSELKTAFVRPGDSIGLEAGEVGPNGMPRIGFITPPTTMNEHHIQGREQMQNDRKELGGFTDSLRGIPVSNDPSGELQKVTMQAAAGIVSSISKHSQGCIKHLSSLMLYSLVHYLSPQQAYASYKRFRPEVLAAIHLSLAPNAPFKVDAILASGAGSIRDQRRAEAKALNQQVDPVSGFPLLDGESVQEEFNRDPQTILQRNMRAFQQKMQLTQPQGQQQKPPMEQINFRDVPPEAQSQMLQQAGIQISPQQTAQHQMNQQAQKQQEMAMKQQQNQPPAGASAG